jgi:hypothetical protein
MPTKNRSFYQCSDTHGVQVEATVLSHKTAKPTLSKSSYCIAVTEIYSVTTLKPTIFIVTAVRTLYLTS